MDAAQRREICDRLGRTVRDVLVLGDPDPRTLDVRPIRDPMGQPRAVFEEAYARIARCVQEVERAIGELGAPCEMWPRRNATPSRAAAPEQRYPRATVIVSANHQRDRWLGHGSCRRRLVSSVWNLR